jgi:Na+-transporting NADH:ubiquinone oxidoreductase subunit NqrE
VNGDRDPHVLNLGYLTVHSLATEPQMPIGELYFKFILQSSVFINTFDILFMLKVNYEVNVDGIIHIHELMISKQKRSYGT